MSAVYYVVLDIPRNGFSTLYHIGDISSLLLGTCTWNNGMSDPDQSFAPPSRLTMQLDNVDGAFIPETLGAELLTNGDFATWSGGNPSSWTVTGEVATDPEVSEVSADKLHGGGGNGSCNLFTSSADVTISQLALVQRLSYQVQISVTATAGNTGYIACYYGSVRISPYYHMTGNYTFYFNTDNVNGAAFKITATGACDMTVDNVSVKQTSLYGHLVDEGILCRFAIVDTFSYYQFFGRLSSIDMTPGTNSRRIVTLTFDDLMYDFLDTEYIPPLYTDTTADVPIQAILEAPICPYPYAYNFWMLEVQGSSELDLTTQLYDPPNFNLDAGIQTFAWVGDNTIGADKKGTNVQSFMRDLVEGEIGGRFFFESYPTLGFVFHNRHRDALNKTVAYTITEDDYEPEQSLFGKTEIINKTTVNYSPRTSGTAGTVIWQALNNVEIVKTSITITVRYRDITNPDARIGAVDVIPPLAGTDYVVQNLATGEDCTSSVTVTVVAGANSAEMTIINPNSFTVHFSILRLRGTPLTTFDSQSTSRVNKESQQTYKTAPEIINYRLIDNQIDAQSIADLRVYKFADPQPVFKKIGFNKDKTASRLAHGLLNPIGERITITDSYLNHNQDYFVVGYRHTVKFGGDGTHDVVYTLKPAAKDNYWILGTSLLDTQTRLGL